jgi:nitrate/nitrite-specific signal transduction histidine kinase
MRIFILFFSMMKKTARSYEASEEFFEDFGNHLTRIQVLSEILDRKIRPTDPEGKKLIRQIRNSLSVLWLGGRDMLWALSHTAHTLEELVSRISQIGLELFKENSAVVFTLENKISRPGYIVPPGYCLNILIIFKEIMIACSKYPEASFIRMKVENKVTGEVTLSLQTTSAYSLQQHLKNKLDLLHIEKCARRFQGLFTISNSSGEFAICRLVFNPFDEKAILAN